MAEKQKIVICPYCGNAQHATDRCEVCRGLFEPLSRRATQISMGPWYVRGGNPYLPGCSFEMIKRQIAAGRIKPNTIMRGPTTRQFWTVARKVPGVAVLLGYCDACNARVETTARRCRSCGNFLTPQHDRDGLGLQYPTDAAAEQAQRQLDAKLREIAAGTASPANATKPTAGGTTAGAGADVGITAPTPSAAKSQPGKAAPGVGANLLDEIFEDDAPQHSSHGREPRHRTLNLDSGADVAPAIAADNEDEAFFDQDAGRAPRRYSRRSRSSPAMGLLIATNLFMLMAVVVLAVVLMRGDGQPQLPSFDDGTPTPSQRTNTPGDTTRRSSPARSDATPPPLPAEPARIRNDVPAQPPVVDDTATRTPPPAPTRRVIPEIEEARRLAEAKKFNEAVAVLERYQRETPVEAQPYDLADLIAHLKEQARLSEIEETGFFDR